MREEHGERPRSSASRPSRRTSAVSAEVDAAEDEPQRDDRDRDADDGADEEVPAHRLRTALSASLRPPAARRLGGRAVSLGDAADAEPMEQVAERRPAASTGRRRRSA